MMGGGAWRQAWTYDSQCTIVNGSTEATLDMTAVSLAWNEWRYEPFEKMLYWRMRVEFSKALGAGGVIALFKIPQIVSGTDTLIDINRIPNGDAATNFLCARLDSGGNFFTGGGHNVQWFSLWCGSTLLGALGSRKKYIKLLNNGGGNFLDTSAAATTHVFQDLRIPVE